MTHTMPPIAATAITPFGVSTLNFVLTTYASRLRHERDRLRGLCERARSTGQTDVNDEGRTMSLQKARQRAVVFRGQANALDTFADAMDDVLLGTCEDTGCIDLQRLFDATPDAHALVIAALEESQRKSSWMEGRDEVLAAVRACTVTAAVTDEPVEVA